MKRIIFYLWRVKKKEKKNREGKSGGAVEKKKEKREFSLVNRPHDF